MDKFEKENMDVRIFDAEVRMAEPGTDDKPVIVGVAAVYNRKSEVLWGFREMIEPGFFENVMKDDVRALWNHNADLVLGRRKNGSLNLEDTERGLEVRIIPPDTQIGRDAQEYIRRGDVDQMSFGFIVKSGGDEWRKEADGSILRVLKRGGCERLFDVSPVTYPAYPQTSVNVRSMAENFAAGGQAPTADAVSEERLRVKREHLMRKHRIRKLLIGAGETAPTED